MLRAFLTSGIFACFVLPQTATVFVSGRLSVCSSLIYMVIGLMCRCLLSAAQPPSAGPSKTACSALFNINSGNLDDFGDGFPLVSAEFI